MAKFNAHEPGDVFIRPGDDASALQSVGGDCRLYGGASAPALASVGGVCVLHGAASAPALASVGGVCMLYGGASAPALASVGGVCVLHEGTSAPALASVGEVCVLHEGARAPTLKTVHGGAEVIAVSRWVLGAHLDGTFSAGCQERLTREEALKHWGEHRTDERATIFREAILAHATPNQPNHGA